MSDQSQQAAWRADYTPFGNVVISRNTVDNPLRFPGQYFDAETGLHYNYSRDYDPAIGRYVQSDPIGLVGGFATYAYVGGNPIRYWDRSGLEAFPSDFADIDSSRATLSQIGIGALGTIAPAAFILAAGETTIIGSSIVAMNARERLRALVLVQRLIAGRPLKAPAPPEIPPKPPTPIVQPAPPRSTPIPPNLRLPANLRRSVNARGGSAQQVCQ